MRIHHWPIAVALGLMLVVPGKAARMQDGESLVCPTCEGCTSVLVGKAASMDGSTMTSHSCDSTTDRTWMNIVPNAKHKPGEMAKVYYEPKRTKGPDDPDRIETGEIPQVAETYAYLNAAYPIMNEHQLAIGETTFGGKREMQSDKGIIDCPELYRLVLERAKTAREAIRIADELTKLYGYNDYGEAFTFADPKEIWFFEILGPGKGKKGAVWAAVRIPDDHVCGVGERAPHPEVGSRGQGQLSGLRQRLLAGRGARATGTRRAGSAFEFCTVVRLAQRPGQPPPRVARPEPDRAVAQARPERRALPAVGEGREEAGGAGRAGDLPRHLPGHARST